MAAQDSASHLSRLPCELIMKIWKNLTLNDRLHCRQVCHRWSELWRRSRFNRIPIRALRISKGAADTQLKLKILRYYELFPGKELTLDLKNDNLQRYFSLVDIRKHSTLLILDGSVVTRSLLEEIVQQAWDITNLNIFGDLTRIDESDLCYMIEAVDRCGSGLQDFILSNCTLKSGQFSDLLIQAIPNTVKSIIIDSKNCIPQQSISDASLHHLIQVGRQKIILPPCSVTSNGVEEAIKRYFNNCTEQARLSIMGCLFPPLSIKLPYKRLDDNNLKSIGLDGIRTQLMPAINYQFSDKNELFNHFVGERHEFAIKNRLMKASIYYETVWRTVCFLQCFLTEKLMSTN
uniref:F-box domain-containing protein n=1 Tax=Syphacia muris TaxID=451379 RepID=A0A0N5AHL8_9BILA